MPFDHYFSKSLAKRWRIDRDFLHHFDVATDVLDCPRWKDVYAKDDLNSPTLEGWLRDVVETPFGNARRGIEAGDPSALDVPQFRRAAVLMLALQGSRTSTALEGVSSPIGQHASRTLEGLATWPLDEIDEFVRQYLLQVSLNLVVASSPMAVPSTGIFSVYFADPRCLSGKGVGSALPIDPTRALVAMPTEDPSRMDLSTLAESLAPRSFGNSNSRFVILPRSLVEAMPPEQLKRYVRERRKVNDDMLDRFEEHRAIVANMLQACGLEVEEDLGSRLQLKRRVAGQQTPGK
jgi:hypothetical protein